MIQGIPGLGAHPPKDIVSIHFFTVRIATPRVLLAFLILSNDRRRILHFNVTDSPAATWTARQIIEAFPWDTAPRFLVRDRGGTYGPELVRRTRTHLGLITASLGGWNIQEE